MSHLISMETSTVISGNCRSPYSQHYEEIQWISVVVWRTAVSLIASNSYHSVDLAGAEEITQSLMFRTLGKCQQLTHGPKPLSKAHELSTSGDCEDLS